MVLPCLGVCWLACVLVGPSADAPPEEPGEDAALAEVLEMVRRVERQPLGGSIRWTASQHVDVYSPDGSSPAEPTVKWAATSAVGGRGQLDPFMLAFEGEASGATFSQWLARSAVPEEALPETGRSWMTVRSHGISHKFGRSYYLLVAEYRAEESGGDAYAAWSFYLDPDHDYLPVRAEFWKYRCSEIIPIETIYLVDLVQSDGGRWFPRRAVHERFDEDAARRDFRKRRWTGYFEMELRPNADPV
ncbi:hypothetical protein [Alienimonas sp. DA493]|uniref:hypothetical protein n=1 Tax=Alienimonas sp. DA493 TaxID=3373605 RepID=UPI003754E53C